MSAQHARSHGPLSDLHLRPAQTQDLPAISALQRASIRTLGKRFYSALQIESVIRHMTMLEDELLLDRTYYVAEFDRGIAGCGGWSLREPAYARSSEGVGRSRAPKVRAMYVQPDFARCGVGRALLAEIERAIVEAGWREASLEATLPGVPFYKRCGYAPVRSAHLVLSNSVRLPVVHMTKRLRVAAEPPAALDLEAAP